ncbi:MAG: hypothetical protein ACFCVK_23505 [Acidimicrobiales bacterium]
MDDAEMGDADTSGGGSDEVTTVRALLAAAGLTVPEPEVERLAGLYPGLRRGVDRFHGIDVGDEVPAAVFRASISGEETGR